jgi:hypothetical protein
VQNSELRDDYAPQLNGTAGSDIWPLGSSNIFRNTVYILSRSGGASVLLNKPAVEVETYNDLDLRITRLFRVLRDRGNEFVAKASLITHSQVEFESAAAYPTDSSDLEMAVCDFVRWRQSVGGQGRSWSYTTGRAGGGMAGDVNAW